MSSRPTSRPMSAAWTPAQNSGPAFKLPRFRVTYLPFPGTDLARSRLRPGTNPARISQLLLGATGTRRAREGVSGVQQELHLWQGLHFWNVYRRINRLLQGGGGSHPASEWAQIVFSIASISPTSRQISASASTNQGAEKGKLILLSGLGSRSAVERTRHM